MSSTSAVPEAPSSSVTLTVMVYMPACGKVRVVSHVRSVGANVSWVPSSHSTSQVWVSLAASVNGASKCSV